MKPKSLKQTFALRNLGPVECFLGLEITRDASGIYINQRPNIDKLLAGYGMINCNPVKSPLDVAVNLHERTEEEKVDNDYRTRLGKLLHLAVYTCADFAYAVNKLAQYSSDPSTIHLDALKRLLRYLNGTKDFCIHYSSMPSPLFSFPDASYIDDHNDRKSTSGWLFMLNHELIVFASKKQSKIAQSTAEAEIIALNEAARESYYICHFLLTLPFTQLTGPTMLLTDSAPAIANIKTTCTTTGQSTLTSNISTSNSNTKTAKSTYRTSLASHNQLTFSPRL
jgi:hypothetical protein